MNYNYNYDYGYYDTSSMSETLGILSAISGVFSFIIIVIGVFSIICQWKIFTKAGREGWKSLIPIYNIIVLFQIAGLSGWSILLFFVPIANIYIMFKLYISLAHKFGKSTGFGVATVFFGVICLPILAFDKSQYLDTTSVNYQSNSMNSQANMTNMNSQNNMYQNQNTNVMNNQNNIYNEVQNNGIDQNVYSNINQVNTNTINNQNYNMNTPYEQMSQPIHQEPVQNVNSIYNELNELGQNNNINQNINMMNNQNYNMNASHDQMNNPAFQTPVQNVNTGLEQNSFNNVVDSNVNQIEQSNDFVLDGQTEKTCPNCGNKVDHNANFCTMCGKSF